MYHAEPDAHLTQSTAPLTEAQNGLWYAQRLDPQNPIYNTGHTIEIDGALDLDAFNHAVAQALSEADALATRFVVDADDVPQQVFSPAWRPQQQLIDLRQETDPRAAAQTAIDHDLATPVEPTRDALTTIRLYQLGDARYLWYQRVHHLLTDGYGMLLLELRIAELYNAYCQGESTRGSALADYSAVQAEDAAYVQSEQRSADAQYWREQFAQAPTVVSLAEGSPHSAHTWLRSEAELPLELVAAIKQYADRINVPWPDVITLLTTAYLKRHISGDSITIGVPHMGRLGSASARVPAMVMNVLPLQVQIDELSALDAQAIALSKQLRKARRHGRYRSEQLRRDLGLLGGTKRLYGPLVNVLPFDMPMQLDQLRTERTVLSTGPIEDLTITFRANAATNGLLLTLDANPNLYDQARIDAHRIRLQQFLTQSLSHRQLGDVPTLTPQESEHWLYGVNATAHPVPYTTLTALIETQLRSNADAIALEFAEHKVSYAALERASAALRDQLIAAGVSRGDVIAVMMPRSLELVISLVAILRAGAAYMPLDLTHPAERIQTIINTAQPRLGVCINSTNPLLPRELPQLEVNAAALLTAPASHVALLPIQQPQPDSAAYVIFTSGSTGTPKGVLVEHDAIVNRLEWMRQHYGIGPDERILQKTPATFDVSVWEFFLPLISGATLVVAPAEAHKDPQWLAQLIREQHITTLHFVPSMLAAFLSEPNAEGIDLRRVFCSGEALPAALRDRFHQLINGELHNLYGPTEAAVDVTYWSASRDDHSQPVPIGFPAWNTAMYVLDDALRPVPAGVVGHLYIAGRQLARGYLGRPDLTEQRFVPNPYGGDGERMYATGDVARWRDDGAIEFLGRSDHQVKIRGLRIELDEIETVLASAPGVDKLAVIAREDTPEHQYIVAYVVANAVAPLSIDALREHCARKLPDYMVPAVFMMAPDLPVTANGKLDRKALPSPAFASRQQSRPPASEREHSIAALFNQVLQRPADAPPVGADDDFFELGGHSLLAAQLIAHLRRETQQALGLGALFEHPTVARLASYIDQLSDSINPSVGNEGFAPVLRLQAGDPQHAALFCLHPAGGLDWCYGGLARALTQTTPRPVYGLQARALDERVAAPESMEAMARDYVDTLVKLQRQGPYHLLGWSVGGIIAQAMAVELQRRGLPIGVLAILDAYPSDVWRREAEPEENAALKALLLIAGFDPGELHDVALEREAVIGFLRRSGHPLGELSDSALRGVIRVVENNNRLVRQHWHSRYHGQALYFRAALDHQGRDLHPSQWQPYLDAIEVHDVPSLHAHLTGTTATQLIVPILEAALKEKGP